MGDLTHLIEGDGSIAKCGLRWPDKITYFMDECDCEECRRLHFIEVNIPDPNRR